MCYRLHMSVRLIYTQIGALSGVSCGTVELLYAVCDSNVSVCIYCVSSPLKSNEIHSVTLELQVPYICRTVMGHRHLEMLANIITIIIVIIIVLWRRAGSFALYTVNVVH